MEKVVISLSENLSELKDELEKEVKKLNSKFSTKKINLNFVALEEADRGENKELKQKEKELKNLVTSAKQKISRNSHGYLELLLDQQEELIHQQNISISSKETKDLKRDLQETKQNLRKEPRLNDSDIENICQKQIEITRLKIQLKDLQTQSSRIEQSTST